MAKIKCLYCGKEVEAIRPTRKKFCSLRCNFRYIHHLSSERQCKLCGKTFPLVDASDNNRRYCSQACEKKAITKNTKAWWDAHPEANAIYQQRYLAKTPGAYRDKARRDRLEAIRILGGKCIICGGSNPSWLHVDYIPTTNGKPYRHPRHLKYIKDHISDFRLLCANHHYELTLTGKIVGTMITQNAQHS